ncbi:UDP-N-acetylmuramoyl-L-alanyl-D-glutamate--2,6-diaminopimelate ligase [Candidatus Sumerlaeota bacterium]|nr:UDP-N-acetylmuramoyl-L-alanyl-D-glutamate--2,6-diaminopimelate ligase [Candidatus Sumerlaeota bacterium]
MASLLQLLKKAGLSDAVAPADDADITYLAVDSRKAGPGALFIALRGTAVDSHQFIGQVVEAGAAAVVAEADYDGACAAPLVRVKNTRLALAQLAHAFHGFPARDMRTCGVTGTNGKTTVAFLMEGIFKAAGLKPGLLGTVFTRYPGTSYLADQTTPGPLELAEILHEMRDAGVDALSMEASSHGIEQNRVAGIAFECGILTNITGDHLDYHGTFEEYAAVKKRFFTDSVTGVRVLNLDDPCGAQWRREFGDAAFGYGRGEDADARLMYAESDMNGTRLMIEAQNRRLELRSPMRGTFNIENLLAAACAGMAIGFSDSDIVRGLESVQGVPGRFEVVDAGQPFDVVVDFAHTGDALRRTLSHAKELARGRLVVVFGCGGNRDPRRRSSMGQAAGELCDWIIVTNDNPRMEDPQQIAEQILKGVMSTAPKSATVDMILDRRQAIIAAIEEAQPDDMIIIAGKGHEHYEITGNQLLPFDDREVVREAIGFLHKGGP